MNDDFCRILSKYDIFVSMSENPDMVKPPKVVVVDTI